MTSKGLLVGEPEMSVVVIGADRSGVELEVREEARLRVPKWFGEAVLLGRYWLDSGLVGYLEEEVRVVRGRMGRYEVADFVLLLNSYAISGEKTLADFFKALAPVQEVLMGVWGRYAALPSGAVPLGIELESIFGSHKPRSGRTVARAVRVRFRA